MEEYLLDLKEVCRVCLERGNMMSIFELNISNKIMECTSVQVWPNDGLPGLICTKCLVNLQVSFQFKELCVKSDATLRLTLSGMTQSSQNVPSINKQKCEFSVKNNKDSYDQPPTMFKYNANIFNYASQQQEENDSKDFDKVENDGINTELLYPVTQIKTEACFSEDVNEPIDNHSNKNEETHNECIVKEEHEIEDYKSSDYIPEDYTMQTSNTFPTESKLNEECPQDQTCERPFKCDLCEKSHSAKGNLNQHMKTHFGVMYKCDKCDKCFSMEYNLKRHYNIHTGDNLYKCDKCERSFTNKGHLREHELVHIDHRPFKCDKCDKSFRRKTHLKQHDKLHTGLKPFQCNSCEKRFHQEKDLFRHERMHTGDRPYKCIECEKCFREKEDLMKHIRTHNKVNKIIKSEQT